MARDSGPMTLSRYGWEPSYSGIQTFMKLPLCLNPDDLRAGGIDVAIGGVPWDGTNTARSGTHLGPQAIRRCDNLWSPPYGRPHLHTRIDFFDQLKMADYGDAEVVPGNTKRTFANIRRFVGDILAADAIPIILGGDHAITGPDVFAVADAYGFGSVGVIQFDAHTDTAPLGEDGIGNHGTQMRELIEAGAIKPENLIQIAIRGYWPPPEITQWMEEQGIRTHYMAEIQQHGFDAVLERAMEEARGVDHLFLTVDVDSADPAYAPGTGSLEPGGLTSRELLRAVRRIAHEVGIVGMDVVEVSPPYDTPNNITAMLAHRCVLEALTGLAMRRAGIDEADYLDKTAARAVPPADNR
jgi:agmatinase